MILFMGRIALFFMSSIGIKVLIGIAATFVVGFVWKGGYNYAMAKCERTAQQRIIEIQQRDIRISQEAERADKAEQDKALTEQERDDAANRALAAEEEKRMLTESKSRAANCPAVGGGRLTPRDIERLR